MKKYLKLFHKNENPKLIKKINLKPLNLAQLIKNLQNQNQE